ncbi:MAG: hypothetical protein A3F82_06235 [Deltaproteobacteria bacterium RIFCSPLOWO2_12_FULL_44_12]|nr:MAG: hypothetical protein A2712_01070 [Deltaproteobacteria bacterium RIFCSPHIGHO2_01_FULL_43_49]OGQ15272.1 MAG: hypothetical protein A3D22_04405 [Deltaproteobacteria bacterium RIFCSPHIGHO2_02_FULL_44_53]OGQ27104.1 MAG: hypothetical protein A3D98_01660 [Deltaproteobacteria bacterium RIFCSPHIGHO2_12_FULL_44_21]OGQ42990.1 MAG: hypothetical protein A3I70_07870 [Deltaproteobacteria bacterium RIFCSPLOWO2_02_FULL_44_34]OGQ70027.1 MAG: hypothetical protein A3F82_06235 [Deltaproteobacteria bacterium 
MTGITLSGIGPRFDRVEKSKVTAMPLLLNGIPSFMAIDAKHRIAMTLSAFLWIELGIGLMFGNPARLMTLGFWKFAADMANGALLSSGQWRIGIVVAGVTPQAIHLFPVCKIFLILVTILTLKFNRLKKPRVHLMIKKVKGMFYFFLCRNGACHQKKAHHPYENFFSFHGQIDNLA